MVVKRFPTVKKKAPTILFLTLEKTAGHLHWPNIRPSSNSTRLKTVKFPPIT